MDKGLWLQEWLVRGVNTMEKLIVNHNNGGPFVFGDEISCADVFFYPQIMNTKNRFKVDISAYPNVTRILSNLQQVK